MKITGIRQSLLTENGTMDFEIIGRQFPVGEASEFEVSFQVPKPPEISPKESGSKGKEEPPPWPDPQNDDHWETDEDLTGSIVAYVGESRLAARVKATAGAAVGCRAICLKLFDNQTRGVPPDQGLKVRQDPDDPCIWPMALDADDCD